MRRRLACGFLLGLALLALGPHGNAQRDERRGLSRSAEHEGRNLDARPATPAADAARGSAVQLREIETLRAGLPKLDAQIDPVTGVTQSLWNRVGYLTEPDGRPARDIADSFIFASLDALGLAPGDVSERELTDVVYSRVTGATHFYYRQRLGGIPPTTRNCRCTSIATAAFWASTTVSCRSSRPP